MRFIDQVYSMYQDQLQDNEEDAISIVLSLLEDQSREDVMKLVENMSEDEVIQMMGIYLVEMLKLKMIQDGKLSPFSKLTVPHDRLQ
ncbi:DUF6154 family protein [Risungbinella massiliensis]|uniref:DUF6154 family protein n=1 Tax=Risungbinella massiliensis TaxID=1329796 RepID=UPI0005CC5FC2|nr:DUF6154 family protein [Risungbinella massiliensis]